MFILAVSEISGIFIVVGSLVLLFIIAGIVHHYTFICPLCKGRLKSIPVQLDESYTWCPNCNKLMGFCHKTQIH